MPGFYKISAIFICIAIIVNGVENLVAINHFGKKGMLSWDVLETSRKWTLKGPLSNILRVIYSERGFWVYTWIRILLGVSVIGICIGHSVISGMMPYLMSGLFVLVGIFHFRNNFGLDGSDQMSIIVLFALSVIGIFRYNDFIVLISIGFVAFQCCLSYVTAGFAKVIAKDWRSGKSLTLVMRTQNYGDDNLYKYLVKNPSISFILTWLMLIFECTFPLALLSYKLCIFYLIGGVVFHLLNARIMGLNIFVWAFLATYPAVIYLSMKIALF